MRRLALMLCLSAGLIAVTASPAAAQTLAPSSLTFPPTEFRQESAPQALTFTNTGMTTFHTFVTTNSTPPNAGSFFQTNNCPAFMLSATSCTINVTMIPADPPPFAKSGTLDMSNGAGPTASLSGTGIYAGGGKKKCKKKGKKRAVAAKKKCKKKK